MNAIAAHTTAEAIAALSASHISKTFGKQKVLDDVALSIQPGEIRALVGENGSGKSTLVKILAGVYEADDGASIVAGGRELDPSSMSKNHDALRFVHQDLGLVDTLDSVDNLALGRGYRTFRRGRIRLGEEARLAHRSLQSLGHDIDVHRPVRELTATEKTAIAVARALADAGEEARLLVLDEPTANMPAPDVERLVALIRNVASRGIAVLFISHHLDEVFGLAESVTVLRDGKLVGTRPVEGLSESELLHMMLGREFDNMRAIPGSAKQSNEIVLSTQDLRGKTIDGVDLAVRRGEIVGVAGISGSGREEIAGLIFGAAERSGTVSVAAKELAQNRPDLAKRAGVGLVPAERRTNAAFMDASLKGNITIADQRPNVIRGILRPGREASDAQLWLDRMKIRKTSDVPIRDLSGGNQQRVILARWLRVSPRVLILDEPTQGVDVGAKSDIHHILRAAADSGTAILVASSDHDELASLCHRVLILRDGHVTHELSGAELLADNITIRTIGSDNSPTRGEDLESK